MKDEDESLTIPLSKRVDLEQFAEKILSFGEVYAYCEEEKILGLIAFYANDKEKRIAYLTYICVNEKNRVKGMGLQMMDWMRKVCMEKGMKKIRLSTNVKNKNAQRFYENQGYQKIESSADEYVYELKI